jgi:hypothetical protein
LRSAALTRLPGCRRDAPQTQHYSVVKVRGDGRCMFRALVRSLVSFALPRQRLAFTHPRFDARRWVWRR